MKKFYNEPARKTPVVYDADICVIGGSCTGLFAAIRAARLGARVAIVEKQNCFGGVATAASVAVWHSLRALDNKQTIIAGLTHEVIERLKRRDAVAFYDARKNFALNTEELKIELDEMAKENKVKPFLHTFFADAIVSDDKIEAIVIENKDGRQAIRAKYFVDASGDADLARRSGVAMRPQGVIQPPTTVAKIQGFRSMEGCNWIELINKHGEEFDLEEDWGWGCAIPGLDDILMRADVHSFNVDVSKAEDLTNGEIEGRRKIRAMLDILRKYGPAGSRLGLVDLPATIGGRDSWHVATRKLLTGDDILHGKRFDDAIANGTYPVDIHHADRPGITFRYLDGRERIVPRRGAEPIIGRWREETEENPMFYQIPLSCLQQKDIYNLALAGRLLDADEVAFSAARVMVNMNQTGEAAGVACVIAAQDSCAIAEVDAQKVRKTLTEGGSSIV